MGTFQLDSPPCAVPQQRVAPSPVSLLGLAALLPAVPADRRRSESPARITAAEIRATIDFLARREHRGRRAGTPENRKIADWLVRRFPEDRSRARRRRGLPPRLQGQQARLPQRRRHRARRRTRSEYLVVGAHYDGIGSRGSTHYPAADDNASGVAALLAIAEATVARRKRAAAARRVRQLRRRGDRAARLGRVRPRPGDPERRHALRTDLRHDRREVLPLAGQVRGRDGQRAQREDPRAGDAARARTARHPSSGSARTCSSRWVRSISRSDYQAYRREDVPFLFLSTGTPWYYHKPEDTPARIDYEQAAETTRFARDLVLALATSVDPRSTSTSDQSPRSPISYRAGPPPGRHPRAQGRGRPARQELRRR